MILETPIENKNWIIQLNDTDNALAVLKNFIRLLNVKITETSLKFYFENHEDYPSMNAINDTLKHWGFETIAAKVETEKLQKLVLPAILYLDRLDKFVIATEIIQQNIFYLNPSIGWINQRIDKFSENWHGITLMAIPGENSFEPHYEKLSISEKSRKKIRVKIDCVYILCSELNESKKEALLEKLRILDLNEETKVNLFNAIDGKNLQENDLMELGVKIFKKWKLATSTNKWWNRDLKEGEIGCSLSHYFIWKDAYDNGYDKILILEEDFLIVYDDFSSINDKYDWELFFLGRNKVFPDIKSLDNQIVVPDYSYCTHAYLLDKRGIKKLINSNFENNIIPVDEFLSSMFCDHPRRDLLDLFYNDNVQIKALALKHNVVIQDPSRISTTENSDFYTIEKSIYDLFLNKELWVQKSEDYEQWAIKFVNPAIISGDFDLIVDEVAPNVFKFPLFNPLFCSLIIEEAEHRNKWSSDRHKNYPTYDVTLSTIGIQNVFQYTMNKYIMPLAMHLWDLKGDAWMKMNGDNFISKYTTEVQSSLSLHHDGSEITVNVCLNDQFTGGGTVFPKYKSVIRLTEPGYALIHPGSFTHLHGGRPITGGKRYILVSFLNK